MEHRALFEAIAKATSLGLSLWMAWRVLANLRRLGPLWLRATGQPLSRDLNRRARMFLRRFGGPGAAMDFQLSAIAALHLVSLLSLAFWAFAQGVWALDALANDVSFALPRGSLSSMAFPMDPLRHWMPLLALRWLESLLGSGAPYVASILADKSLRSLAKTGSTLGLSFAREIALSEAAAAAAAERSQLASAANAPAETAPTRTRRL